MAEDKPSWMWKHGLSFDVDVRVEGRVHPLDGEKCLADPVIIMPKELVRLIHVELQIRDEPSVSNNRKAC